MKHRLAACMAITACVPLIAAMPAQAATTSKYSVSLGGTIGLYNVRTWMPGTAFSAPAGTPSAAKITTVSGQLGMDTAPSNMHYLFAICTDNEATCYDFDPTVNPNANTFTTNVFSGMPATTKLRFYAAISDGSSSNILAALKPPLYSKTQTATVNYTY